MGAARDTAIAQARTAKSILVIKLSALGDFIHAFHPFAAIRAAHPDARITLLTTRPFVAMAKASPWFDAVIEDERAPWWDLGANARLKRRLQGFDLVYDLQTAGRTSRYFRLAGRPLWSGIAPGCALPHANPERDGMHTLERQREQLVMAGIETFPVPDKDWLVALGQDHGLKKPYVMLVVGGAGKGSPKRWPAERYGELCRRLLARGLSPVLIGARLEAGIGEEIEAAAPGVVNLIGKTSIPDLAAIARRADLALGNDSGPLQLAAAVGAPTLALFSHHTRPPEVAPRGPRGEWAKVLQKPHLDALEVDEVEETALAMLQDNRFSGAEK
jgi:ADP-heptose:LPS heptosyltransferase